MVCFRLVVFAILAYSRTRQRWILLLVDRRSGVVETITITPVEILFLATGFTGALTVRFLLRLLHRLFVVPPTIAAYHSPRGGCTQAVVGEILRARKEVLVQAYSFTSKPIADALLDAKGRGVHVEILLDRSNEQETYTELSHLIQNGLAPHIDAQHAIAHNKIMIIDRRVLITGSFNFTHQAEAENAENLLIIKGHPELLRSYRQSFAEHKAHCQAPSNKVAPVPQRKAA
jgi:phosphatidylserine/phosphatidylglycerophosphate/cardiolipin synthase-like enzyme